MPNSQQILEDSIFKVGRVVSVDGRTVRIKVDKTKNTSHVIYKGELLKNVSVGGYVKIVKGFTKIIGKVDGEFTSEDPLFAKKDYTSEREKISRSLSVSLLGFFKGINFERGIKELPLVGNECFLLQVEEFNNVHNFVRRGDDPLPIGRLALEKGQCISVGVNSLFASHVGIFGNTGSGKSYTLAKLYYELFQRYKSENQFHANARFVLIDFNGEYVSDDTARDDDIIVQRAYKEIFKLSTRATEGRDKYPIEKEALFDPSFWIVFLEATEKTQSPFLIRALEGGISREIFGGTQGVTSLQERLRQKLTSFTRDIIDKKDKVLGSKIFIELFNDVRSCVLNQEKVDEILAFINHHLEFNGTTGSYFVVNTQLIGNARYDQLSIDRYFLEPLKDMLAELAFVETDITSIRLRIIIKYYDEIIKGYSNRDHIAPLMKRLDTRAKDIEKVITVVQNNPQQDHVPNIRIISLRDVNLHIRKILPMLLCKNLYDGKKKAGESGVYLNIIIDEAHNILSSVSERESEQWKDYRLETFEEIIKEGRKFGVFLTIASQRPADISPTIISQLHNFFLHRLINNNDILAVEKTISYLDKVSFDYLPILPTGTCILAGLVAQVPVVVDVGPIPEPHEPRNKTMTLVEKWKANKKR